MLKTTSPLRYPGGKTCLADRVAHILRVNRLERGHYAEPYAGGCGLALALLYGGHVSDIHINDLDRSIWAFWHAVLNRTEEFVDKIQSTHVTIEQWHEQRHIQQAHKTADQFDLAFATFFLNRTNRSGVIKNAGVIGGLSQTGNYKIDCRFNKNDLVRRIRRVQKYHRRIHLHNMDALDFIDHVDNNLPDDTFLYIDPPYFNKGSKLYTSFYLPNDHEILSLRILRLSCPWIVTYEKVEEIQKLYTSRRQFELSLNYSVQTKRIGSEIVVASKGLRIPDELRARQVHRPQYRAGLSYQISSSAGEPLADGSS